MRSLAACLALIERNGRFFMQRRDHRSRLFPDLWEFPGGKVEAGETPEETIRRELHEELEWAPGMIEALPALSHAYSGFEVVLHPFRCSGPGEPKTELAWGWFRTSEILRLPMPEATGRLVALHLR